MRGSLQVTADDRSKGNLGGEFDNTYLGWVLRFDKQCQILGLMGHFGHVT